MATLPDFIFGGECGAGVLVLGGGDGGAFTAGETGFLVAGGFVVRGSDRRLGSRRPGSSWRGRNRPLAGDIAGVVPGGFHLVAGVVQGTTLSAVG